MELFNPLMHHCRWADNQHWTETDVTAISNAAATTVMHIVIVSSASGGWWRWALLSPDGVAPIRIVGMSATDNLPLHHKVQKFCSGTGSPGWSRKKDRKMVVVVPASVCILHPLHWLSNIRSHYNRHNIIEIKATEQQCATKHKLTLTTATEKQT